VFAASHQNGRENEVAFVDQSCLERLGGESGTAQDEVASGCFLQLENRVRSNSRSIRVLAVDTASSVLEYTIFSADCQIAAKSRMTADCSAKLGSVSQPTIVSYSRRP
jgi:hypothetical protein